MKKHLPNIITLLNLAAGTIAVIFASQNLLEYAAYFVFAGIMLDFFDGFLARILGVQSELGVQLDSLADMVSSGVAPGIVMFQLLRNTGSNWNMYDLFSKSSDLNYLPFLGLLITLAAAYRLAKFNIDDYQQHSFIGLPTPALSIFVLSLPLISIYGTNELVMNLVKDPYFLIVTTILGSILMNSKLPLFSLKVTNFSLKENLIQYLFVVLSILLMFVLQISSIPIIILMYIVLSVGDNLLGSKN